MFYTSSIIFLYTSVHVHHQKNYPSIHSPSIYLTFTSRIYKCVFFKFTSILFKRRTGRGTEQILTIWFERWWTCLGKKKYLKNKEMDIDAAAAAWMCFEERWDDGGTINTWCFNNCVSTAYWGKTFLSGSNPNTLGCLGWTL